MFRFRGLTSVPDELLTAEEIDLTGNEIASLPELPYVLSLRLDGNHVMVLPSLPYVTELFLDGNRLTEFPALPRSIERLHLRRNALRSIPDSIGELQSLRDLRLGGNGLTSVPDALSELSLEMLDLSENELTSIPRLPAVTVLDLGHNRFASLPELTCGDVLYIHDNRLTSLPPLHGSITYLNAGGNPLRALPPDFELPMLRELRVESSQLVDLPASLAKLNICELHVSGNLFAELPHVILEMPSLEVLDLRRNRLLTLPEEIAALPNLRKLDLRWNKLKRVPAALEALRERGCVVML